MKQLSNMKSLWIAIGCVAGIMVFAAWSLLSSSYGNAYSRAKEFASEAHQTQVLSVMGVGTPTEVNTWYFHFYDPTSASKAKLVTVRDGKIDQIRPTEGRRYDEGMSFDPTKTNVGFEDALRTAAEYAEKNQVDYNQTRVYQSRANPGVGPSWRVELLKDGVSKGYVITSASDGSLVSYQTSAPAAVRRDREGSGNGQTGAEEFATDVEKTFKEIGGDLEEFFTGERTVDR
jgi:hypothetical protein